MRRALLLAAFLALPTAIAFAGTQFAGTQSVASFLASKPVPGRYEVVAFVVGSFECPPCPEGAQCEPCPPDAVYVADKPTSSPLTFDRLTGTELVLGTKRPSALRFGGRYRFTFELTTMKTSGRAINDLSLIEAQSL